MFLFDPLQNIILSCGSDNNVCVWNVGTGEVGASHMVAQIIQLVELISTNFAFTVSPQLRSARSRPLGLLQLG